MTASDIMKLVERARAAAHGCDAGTLILSSWKGEAVLTVADVLALCDAAGTPEHEGAPEMKSAKEVVGKLEALSARLRAAPSVNETAPMIVRQVFDATGASTIPTPTQLPTALPTLTGARELADKIAKEVTAELAGRVDFWSECEGESYVAEIAERHIKSLCEQIERMTAQVPSHQCTACGARYDGPSGVDDCPDCRATEARIEAYAAKLRADQLEAALRDTLAALIAAYPQRDFAHNDGCSNDFDSVDLAVIAAKRALSQSKETTNG